jgi:serine/threonine-protein kinase
MLGSAPLDERTDTYLLGAILFEIATGKPPHLCATIEATISSIRATPPSLAGEVPDELATIVRRALAKDPAQRYATVDALREAITGFLEHRGSSALAHEAGNQLRDLEEHLATERTDAAAHRVRTYQLFGQTRFGFQAALRAWPENPSARGGLDSALTAMASHELELGDARAAAVLIAELAAPPVALTERLAVVEGAAADKAKRLARFEADADIEQNSILRTVFVVLCGLVWTMLPFVAGTFPAHEVGHGPAVVATACVVAGILLFGWFTRAEMMQTTFNRGVFLVALFGVVLHGVLEVFAWIAGLDMVVSHMISVGLWAGVVGIAAIFLDRALLVPMLGFMITIVAIARRPATHLLAMSASIAVLLGVMVYIYLGQKRGRRRIAGLADKLRPR